MPFPLPPRARSGPRRRTLLAGVAGVSLAATVTTGCTSDADDPSGTTRKQASAAERARVRTADESRELGERYDRVLAAHPSLAKRLAPLRAEVASHEKAFDRTGRSASPEASAGAAGSVSPATGAAPEPVPDAPREALGWLAGQERKLSGARTARALEVPGELARLLASVAAAGAAHAYLLTEGDK
ncbi:hypothetical protein ACFWIA_09575 [Streptomyces sp. NPDC127068]|uniref:hypothetical protein n=1 Tax=Streptomyces sp. NPDC127068 TaxID=3347127 RepID=UPI0036564D39